MSYTGITKRIAKIYDDKGVEIGQKAFSKSSKTFDFKGHSYNIFQDSATYTNIKRWYWDLEIYHYNVNNPNPFVLNKKCEPILDSEVYNAHLHTKVMKDLNDLSKKGFFGELKPIHILMIIGGIVLIYYLLSGKKIV